MRNMTPNSGRNAESKKRDGQDADLCTSKKEASREATLREASRTIRVALRAWFLLGYGFTGKVSRRKQQGAASVALTPVAFDFDNEVVDLMGALEQQLM